MMNLLLGATEPGAVADGHLEAAMAWAGSRGADAYVRVTPGLPRAPRPRRTGCAANGFAPGYGWMKFVRDAHPPALQGGRRHRGGRALRPRAGAVRDDRRDRLRSPRLGRRLLRRPARAPGLALLRRPASTASAQACAAMLVDGAVAELGIAATLEPARGRGCQPALLHRRIVDAAAAGCDTLLIETGERVPGRPSASYRNILRAGFEEAYLRPNWQRPR